MLLDFSNLNTVLQHLQLLLLLHEVILQFRAYQNMRGSSRQKLFAALGLMSREPRLLCRSKLPEVLLACCWRFCDSQVVVVQSFAMSLAVEAQTSIHSHQVLQWICLWTRRFKKLETQS